MLDHILAEVFWQMTNSTVVDNFGPEVSYSITQVDLNFSAYVVFQPQSSECYVVYIIGRSLSLSLFSFSPPSSFLPSLSLLSSFISSFLSSFIKEYQ